MSDPLHRDAAAIEHGGQILADMKKVTPSLVYAALLTDDGFEVVRVASLTLDGARFASMASSMQALADAVANELSLGVSKYIIIASPRGYVVQLRVPGHPLVLSALFDDDETVGKALAITKSSAEKMSSFLATVAA
jgi:uncharacterized protein